MGDLDSEAYAQCFDSIDPDTLNGMFRNYETLVISINGLLVIPKSYN